MDLNKNISVMNFPVSQYSILPEFDKIIFIKGQIPTFCRAFNHFLKSLLYSLSF